MNDQPIDTTQLIRDVAAALDWALDWLDDLRRENEVLLFALRAVRVSLANNRIREAIEVVDNALKEEQWKS